MVGICFRSYFMKRHLVVADCRYDDHPHLNNWPYQMSSIWCPPKGPIWPHSKSITSCFICLINLSHFLADIIHYFWKTIFLSRTSTPILTSEEHLIFHISVVYPTIYDFFIWLKSASKLFPTSL